MKNSKTLLAFGFAFFANAVVADTLPLSWVPPSGMPPGPVEGSEVKLSLSAEGASIILETSELTPGHAITVWFVAIQSPEKFAANPCTPMEAMGMAGKMNSIATNAGGTVVNAEGSIRVQGFLPVGEIAGNFYDTTFTSPETSEYHIVVRDHGPLIPELAADQISSHRGGCTAESVPPFYPDSSRSDGEGGPNSCVTRQVALFIQDRAASN